MFELGLGTASGERGGKTMNPKYWIIAKVIVVAVFGIGFVLAPAFVASVFGMALDDVGILMAQLFGAAFIFEGIVLWSARAEPISTKAFRGLATAAVVSNTIGFVVTLLVSLSGIWNALGWLPVGLYLVFALAFAYFLFRK
jgi:hypothetical protein